MLRTVLLATIGTSLAASFGCRPPAAAPNEPSAVALAAKFDPTAVGSIRGRVEWTGAPPKVEPFDLLLPPAGYEKLQPNPNVPIVDPKTGGVARTLVFLREADPERSRPWNHDSVEVAFENDSLVVRQGNDAGSIGLVRRGDAIRCISREKRGHVLLGREASFFSLPLTKADSATRRTLDKPGIVELRSGAAFYWLRAYLWVGEHPYATLTDASGGFELSQVPVGEYELVCWRPNWRVKAIERHPELGDIERLIFADPVERTANVAVRSTKAVRADFSLSEAMFGKR